MGTRHLIIGGGPAATNAMQTIRQFDDQAIIELVSDEPAHSRMALPYWIADQIGHDRVLTANDELFQQLGVTARIGTRVASIDPSARQVTLDDQTTLAYDRLLLATGSRPLQLAIPGVDGDRVQPLWTIAHVERLLDSLATAGKPHVAMIGAGFIGLIVLNAMHKRGWKLSVIEREAQVLPRMLNKAAAQLAHDWLGRQGVSVTCGATVQSIADVAGQKRLQLDTGKSIDCDLVIVATGVQPNVELARAAGIEVDHGILVNSYMRTSAPHIFAAGDVAQGPVLHSSIREVHAIQPTAVDHGRMAGANMADQSIEYPGSLSMNVLDVCGLQCVSYGDWSGNDATDMPLQNDARPIYRNLFWRDRTLVGAMFVGQANDVGMLTDAGMAKGLIQTATDIGEWKSFVEENPFDLRRPYIATGVADKLKRFTLLGQAASSPAYRQAAPLPLKTDRPHLKSFLPSQS